MMNERPESTDYSEIIDWFSQYSSLNTVARAKWYVLTGFPPAIAKTHPDYQDIKDRTLEFPHALVNLAYIRGMKEPLGYFRCIDRQVLIDKWKAGDTKTGKKFKDMLAFQDFMLDEMKTAIGLNGSAAIVFDKSVPWLLTKTAIAEFEDDYEVFYTLFEDKRDAAKFLTVYNRWYT